jgi:hypothetical protein
MTQRQNIRRPQPGEIPYLAGEYLYRNGPCSEAELFLAVRFGKSQSERAAALQSAIRGGWLMETQRGKIACSPDATDYYDELSDKPKEEYVGQKAPAPQRNVFASPGLSKKYRINSRGLRPASDEFPAWSQRPAGFAIKHIAGGDA